VSKYRRSLSFWTKWRICRCQQKYKAHVIRFFATLRMTIDRQKITIKERICIFDTPPLRGERTSMYLFWTSTHWGESRNDFWIILTNTDFTIVKEQPPSTPPRGREQACISLNLRPLGGLRGLPHFVKSPPKRPPLLTTRGTVLYLCITRRQRGGNEKSRPCHPHAGVEDGTGDGRSRLSLGIEQGTVGDWRGYSQGLNEAQPWDKAGSAQG